MPAVNTLLYNVIHLSYGLISPGVIKWSLQKMNSKVDGIGEIISPPASNELIETSGYQENGTGNLNCATINAGGLTEEGRSNDAVEVEKPHGGLDVALGRIHIPDTGSGVCFITVQYFHKKLWINFEYP